MSIFHLFPALPIETRLKIWSFTLSTPRTVTISCDREGTIRGAALTAKSWTTDTPTPPLLHVNRESRYEALRIYEPYFTTASGPRPIYLSFTQDTVKFADGVLAYVPRPQRLLIQRMVLQTKDCGYFASYNMHILRRMPRLRELEILAEKRVVGVGGVNLLPAAVSWMMAGFRGAMDADPGWACPVVRIFEEGTGVELGFLEGQLKIPGGGTV